MTCHMKLAILVLIVINQALSNAELVNTDNNPFFKRFHQVNFDSSLSEQHHRARRSADPGSQSVRFKLETHGKTFDIELYPSDEKVFDSDHVLIDGKSYPVSSVQFYKGKIVGQDGSRVTGSIIEGAFVGTVETESDGVYHVEPAGKYKEASKDAQAVVFHSDDIVLDDEEALTRAKRSGENVGLKENERPVGCSLNKREVREKLQSIQQHLASNAKRNINKPLGKKQSVNSDSYKYSQEANEKRRRKRQSSNSFPNGESECGLFMRIDWPMYQAVFNNQGKQNAETTAAYLISFLRNQVSGLNTIFRSIYTYNGNNSLLNYLGYISFTVKKTVINTFDSCNTTTVGYASLSAAEKLLCTQYTDEITMLNDVSMDNYDDYCLSYTFTSRDFSNGALGLAWTAAQGSVGGACTKYTTVNGNQMSLNTAIVTNRLYGSYRPDSATILTFAHEMGHSLGASHDSTSVCAPGGSSGYFIMYYKALSSSATNNNRYSSCSISSMNTFLTYITGTSNNCFEDVTLCGNGVLDDGEVCEYSIDSTCCSTSCTLNSGASCSWSAGSCCSSSCAFQPSGTVCSTGQDCLNNVTCTGSSAVCPTNTSSFFVADNTPCNQNTQICVSGVCQGSICSAFGLTQCTLSGSSYDAATLCHIACTGASTNNQCTDLFTTTGSVYQLLAGSPCNNSYGYCDNYRVCRETDLNVRYNRLLSKFNKLLVSPLSTIGDWIATYWWAVLLIVIGILIINIILVVVLWAVFKTDNPHKRKAYTFADVLKNPLILCKKSSSKKSGKRVPREVLNNESNADETELTPPDSRASSQTQLQPTTSKKSLV